DLEAKHEGWVRSSSALEDRTARLKALEARVAEVRDQGQIAAKLEPERALLQKETEDLDRLREELDGQKERKASHQQGQTAARAGTALARVHENVASIDQDSFVLTEYKSQLEQLKDDLRHEADDSHRLIQPLDDAKIEALRQLDAVPFTEMDEKRLDLVSHSV